MVPERVIEAINEADALKFGSFELSSGMRSDYYIDKYRFQTKPSSLSVIATEIAEQLTNQKLGGVALGAVPLVTAVAMKAENPYVIIRKSEKEYGTNNRIEGHLTEGEKILVVEDVTTTGGSALEAVKVLREAGAKVERVFVVVDRQQGAKKLLEKNGVKLESLVTADDLLSQES